MITPNPPGPSRRTIITLVVLYLLSIGTSVAFMTHSIGSHSQITPTNVPTSTTSTHKHPAVVYFFSKLFSEGVLKLYDVDTSQKVELLHLPNMAINSAQVSPDGQWVLLIASESYERYQLQRIRIDGRQHETLYTFPPMNYRSVNPHFPIAAQWSLDQKSILISTNIEYTTSTISILNIATRKMQTKLQITDTQYEYRDMKWLDQTHIYILALPHGKRPLPPTALYLLDVTAKQARSVHDLQLILVGTSQNFITIDSSPDGKSLFVAQWSQDTDKTTIWREPAMGGKQQIIAHITGDVHTLRAFTNFLLLSIAFIYTYRDMALWRMSLDGSSHTVLFSSDDYTQYTLNRMTQYVQSNVSADETILALETQNPDISVPTLLVRPFHDGKVTKFEVSPGNYGTTFIVGWTTI